MENQCSSCFAELIAGILKAKKTTRKQLAEMMGYDRDLFTRIGNGEVPETRIVITIGVALGLEIQQIEVLLYYTGHILVTPIDKKYEEVITKISGRKEVGLRRILACNEELKKMKVSENQLLGNYARKPRSNKKSTHENV